LVPPPGTIFRKLALSSCGKGLSVSSARLAHYLDFQVCNPGLPELLQEALRLVQGANATGALKSE